MWCYVIAMPPASWFVFCSLTAGDLENFKIPAVLKSPLTNVEDNLLPSFATVKVTLL
jgi:hypothetical protein